MTNYIQVFQGVAQRNPVPDNLPVDRETLADLSWLDPSQGLTGFAWWPEVVELVNYDPTQSTPDGTETLIVDAVERVVISRINLRPLTQDERFQLQQEILREAQGRVEQITEMVYEKLKRNSVFLYGYEQREAAALAHKDADYALAPNAWITPVAENLGMTYDQAVDTIILQGTAMRNEVQHLEALHMRKFNLLRQPTREAIQREFDALVDAIQMAPLS